MTIEIKQLIIRAVADPNPTARPGLIGRSTHPSEFGGVQAANGPTGPQPYPIDLDRERQAIVAACVREVLRKLERSRER